MFNDKAVKWAAKYANAEQFQVVWEYAKTAELHAELACSERLPTTLREEARTSKYPKVRKEFASRRDLTATEVSAILSEETRSEVAACVLRRPLDPPVLDEIASRGRAALLDALIRNCETVELSKASQATQVAVKRAVNSPAATHKNSAAFWDIVASGPVSLLTEIDNINGYEAAYAVTSNPNSWHLPELVTKVLQHVLKASQYEQHNLMSNALISLQAAVEKGPVRIDEEVEAALDAVGELSTSMRSRVHTLLRHLNATKEHTSVTLEQLAHLTDKEGVETATLALWGAGASYEELYNAAGRELPVLEMLAAAPNRAGEVLAGVTGEENSQLCDNILQWLLLNRSLSGEETLRTALAQLPHQARLYNFTYQLPQTFAELEEETKRCIPARFSVARPNAAWYSFPEMGWLVQHAMDSTHPTEAYLALLEGLLDTWSGTLGELVDSVEMMLNANTPVAV